MEAFTIFLTVSFSALFVINIIGNTLIGCTILRVLRIKTLRKPIYALMLNLAIADLMVGIFMSPRFIFNHLFTHPKGVEGRILCTLITGGPLMWCGAVVSFCTIVYIAIERYYAIVHPFLFKDHLSMRKVKISIGISWVFAFLWLLPEILTRRFDEKKQFCVGQWPNQEIARAYSVGWVLVAVVIPLSVMAFVYPRIIKELWFSGDRTVEISQRVRMRHRKRLTMVVIVMTVVHCCCWAPVTIAYCYVQFNPSAAGSYSHKIGMLLAVAISSINPVLHSMQSKELKRQMKSTIMLIVGCCRRNETPR